MMKLSVKIETKLLESILAVLQDLKENIKPSDDSFLQIVRFIELESLFESTLKKYDVIRTKKLYGKTPKNVTLSVTVNQLMFLHYVFIKYYSNSYEYIMFREHFFNPLLKQFKTFSIQLRSSINQ